MRARANPRPPSFPPDPDAPLSPPTPLAPDPPFLHALLATPAPTALVAGLEVGAWNFAASILQAQGVSRTTATAAAFVVSITSLLTPALAAAAGQAQGRAVWGGAALALAGTAALALDKAGGSATVDGDTAALGNAYVAAAAAFYSASTFRLSVHAPRFAPGRLALSKSVGFAGAAVSVAAATLGASVAAGGDLVAAAAASVAGLTAAPAAAALLWTAAGPGAAAAWLQARGQASLKAGAAQALYATVPLWSAVFAAALLGERLGPAGLAGGAAIVAGGVLAAVAAPDEGGGEEGERGEERERRR